MLISGEMESEQEGNINLEWSIWKRTRPKESGQQSSTAQMANKILPSLDVFNSC